MHEVVIVNDGCWEVEPDEPGGYLKGSSKHCGSKVQVF